jgi:hypothetical protein
MIVVSGHVQCQERRVDDSVDGSSCWKSATTQKAERGDIFYIPPRHQVRLVNLSNQEVLAYRTFSYEVGPDHSKRIKHFTIDKLGLSIDPLHEKSRMINGAVEFFDPSIEMDGFI